MCTCVYDRACVYGWVCVCVFYVCGQHVCVCVCLHACVLSSICTCTYPLSVRPPFRPSVCLVDCLSVRSSVCLYTMFKRKPWLSTWCWRSGTIFVWIASTVCDNKGSISQLIVATRVTVKHNTVSEYQSWRILTLFLQRNVIFELDNKRLDHFRGRLTGSF